MRVLVWLFRGFVFFALFAFALNNQQGAAVRWFFGYEWRAPMVFIVLAAFGLGCAFGVVAMVPSWWRHRRVARRAGAATPASEATTVPAAIDSAVLPSTRRAMEFDLYWLLWGLPLAFALGWLASRLDVRQWKREQRGAPKAYFQGLNLLLNEQQDKAIDAFIEAVQQDPDTTELHFALGNLFRRRGEYERAVRVHEHLLKRADLPTAERQRAQQGLAQDFAKAGLFDRAEAAWRELEGTPYDTEARLALLTLHERSHDWRAAVDDAVKLERSGTGTYASRIAHYWCELALEADAHGTSRHDSDDADSALQRARDAAPQAARPLLLAGQRAHRAGRPQAALAHWRHLLAVQPASFALVAGDFAACAEAVGEPDAARAELDALYARTPTLDVLSASLRLEPDLQRRRRRLTEHLERLPSLSAARSLMALRGAGQDAGQETESAAIEAALSHAARPLQRYRCAACGFEAQQYFWQCPGCLNWDTYPPQRLEDL